MKVQIQHLEQQFSEIEKQLTTSKQQAHELEQKIELGRKQVDQCQVLDQWISPLSEKLQSLKRSFLEKIGQNDFEVSSLNEQDVLVFLNLAGLGELIPWFELHHYDGNGLESITDQEMKKDKIPLNKRLEFFAAVNNLVSGVFENKQHKKECPVCKCQTEEEQQMFWNEWNLHLAPELGITPAMLIGFQKTHMGFLRIPVGEQRNQVLKTIKEIKSVHFQQCEK